MKTLLGFAAYYSACAILWVCNQTKMHERNDTTFGRVIPYLKDKSEAPPHEVPQRKPVTTSSRQTSLTDFSGENPQATMMLMSVALIPLLALIIIPLSIKEAPTKKQEIFEKTEEIYPLKTKK